MSHTLIVGGGLAGACAALWLAEHGEAVTVLEAEYPATGASGAAAGLVNPFMGQRANPAWRFEEALAAIHETLALAKTPDLFRPTGILRPARDEAQARHFRERAEATPQHAAWRLTEALASMYPDLAAPHGALWIPDGGSVHLAAMVVALLHAAEARGATVRTGVRATEWGEDERCAFVTTNTSERIEADRIVLALGDGFQYFPDLDALPLHRIKGQTIRLARPDSLADLPALSGFGYVVPDGNTLVVGSSYEHDFEDVQPSQVQSEALRAKAAQMLPALADAEILDARAGVRVTVPRRHSPRRLPLLGPLRGHQRVWVFTGLGSKGLLTAPLLARHLPTYLEDPTRIPPDVQPPR